MKHLTCEYVTKLQGNYVENAASLCTLAIITRWDRSTHPAQRNLNFARAFAERIMQTHWFMGIIASNIWTLWLNPYILFTYPLQAKMQLITCVKHLSNIQKKQKDEWVMFIMVTAALGHWSLRPSSMESNSRLVFLISIPTGPPDSDWWWFEFVVDCTWPSPSGLRMCSKYAWGQSPATPQVNTSASLQHLYLLWNINFTRNQNFDTIWILSFTLVLAEREHPFFI